MTCFSIHNALALKHLFKNMAFVFHFLSIFAYFFTLSNGSINELYCQLQVGSRRVVLAAGMLMMLFGCFSKFSAVVVSMPDPIIGASFLVLFGNFYFFLIHPWFKSWSWSFRRLLKLQWKRSLTQTACQESLTLSLLLTTQEAFVDSVDQDQTAQDMQSELWSTLSTFSFFTINLWIASSSCNGSVFLANQKLRFIFSVAKGLNTCIGTAI